MRVRPSASRANEGSVSALAATAAKQSNTSFVRKSALDLICRRVYLSRDVVVHPAQKATPTNASDPKRLMGTVSAILLIKCYSDQLLPGSPGAVNLASEVRVGTDIIHPDFIKGLVPCEPPVLVDNDRGRLQDPVPFGVRRLEQEPGRIWRQVK